MQVMNSKKAVSTSTITNIASAVIGVVVLFLLLAALVPEANTAGESICAAGLPLGSLFGTNGVLILIIMAGVVLLVVGVFLKKRH